MTDQELFDKVAGHLARQGCQATDSLGRCAYRGSDGMKCAAGCLIADAHYSPEIESKAAGIERVADALERSGVSRSQIDLVSRLQTAHDNCGSLSSLRSELSEIACDFGLTFDPTTITTWEGTIA